MTLRQELKEELHKARKEENHLLALLNKGCEDPYVITDSDKIAGKIEGLELALEIIDKYI